MNNQNSIANQDIKSKFVGREVFANVNSMVEYILNKSAEDREAPFSIDDVENFYSFPEWSKTVVGETLSFDGGTENDKTEFEANFDRLIEESEARLETGEISDLTHERNVELIEEAREEFNDLESDPQDVYEWWIVSGWLCENLKEQGEVVISDQNIWGRCTTGQAILLDGVISRICEDLQILEGQSNEWSRK